MIDSANILKLLKSKIEKEINIDMYYTYEGTTKNDGRWTWEEHRKFLIALFLFGKNWTRMKTYVQSRSTE